MAGLWDALASFGYCGPGPSSRAGKRGGWRALFLGAVLPFSVGLAATKSPGPSPHAEQAHGGSWGQYLSHDGESSRRLVTTFLGQRSVIRRSSGARLF